MIRTLLLVAVLALPGAAPGETVSLTSLDLGNLHYQGWRKPQVDRSFNGKPLSIAGQKFAHGVSTCATSTLWLELDGNVQKLVAAVGVDDAAGNAAAAVTFTIIGDGKKLWTSGVMKRGEAAKAVDLSLKEVRSLLLMADHAGDNNFDIAVWADARFIAGGAQPRTVNGPREQAVILTPPPPLAPRINGPRVYGCRPGNPFLYRIPATGERPMRFAADSLPAGLRLDADKGILTGSAPARGEHTLTLRAKNGDGSASRTLKIVSGDTLALTPPMGWNHWYTHYDRVTDVVMREAADVMVRTGMADAGYSYVNIDGCWQNTLASAKKAIDPLRIGPLRDAAGNIMPNKHFPDMRGLTDYIHAKGLKAGIYSSPGPLDCAGFAGSYQHEEQDARQFADWGFDFLKYDWCSYTHIAEGKDPQAKDICFCGKGAPDLESHQRPYRLMGGILKRLPRDIVLNLCQYGMADVWQWGADVGGHSWRTGDDLGAFLNRLFPVALRNAEHRAWSKPGAWNDPDYLQIGFIGDARSNGAPTPCPLTPSEQYSFMSLWCLMAAPLFYSGDMSQLDAFTLNILCNTEMIEVDQDPLGDSARVVALDDDTFLMVKNMEDGSKVVGLCNRGELPATVAARWSDVGISGRRVVRDLWRQQDLGQFESEFRAPVPRHGVVLVRLR